MGDLANMTDNDGRLNGHRLLKWLRSRAGIESQMESERRRDAGAAGVTWHAGRIDLLDEMADDLERELNPPDYPVDDCDGSEDGIDLDTLPAPRTEACPEHGPGWGCNACPNTAPAKVADNTQRGSGV